MRSLMPADTLITRTPEEGRALAIKIARLTVKATQPDELVRKRLREAYANDALLLVMITQSVAIEFATIAAANRYWSAPTRSADGGAIMREDESALPARDPVDDAIEQSFPASDPPSHGVPTTLGPTREWLPSVPSAASPRDQ